MHKILVVLFVGVLAVLALTFAAWVVLTSFTPEREVMLMQRAMAGVSSLDYDVGVSWLEGEEPVTLYAVGELTATPKLESATRFRVVRLSDDRAYADLSGEIRHAEGRTYLTYAPPGPKVDGVDFDGQTWVVFEAGELAAWGDVLPGVVFPIAFMTPTGVWEAAAIERLRTLMSVADMMLVQHNGFTEIVDGQATRILEARFDPESVEAFLLDLVRAKYGEEPNDDERILAHEQAAKLALLSLRLWVGAKDHLLYRVQLSDGLDARIDFSNHDQPVSIPVPSALAFVDIYRKTFGSLPSSSSTAPQTLVRKESAGLLVTQVKQDTDSDGDGLDSVLETFYGTSPLTSDTDGDGVGDGEEVRAGRNPRGKGSLFGFGLD